MLFAAVWLSGFIAHQYDEYVFLRTLEPYFTGHEYKEVVSRIRPTSFLGFFAVMALRLVTAPLELLVNAATPHSQRVDSFRDALTKALPQYEKELSDWSQNRLEKEAGEED